MNDPTATHAAARLDAKRLLRLARTGAMATLADGAPFVTLIGVASDWDGAPLFLLSDLSRHTKHLDADPRVSLLLTSQGGRGDPLNQPRLTLNGSVRRRAGADGRDRYIRRNPKSKLYVDFTDFSVRRLEIEKLHFNGGFGRADPLAPADLVTAGDATALMAAEPALLDYAEQLGDAALARLAGGGRRIWKPVGIDAEGLDLACGGEPARAQFAEPAFSAEAWRAALARLAG